MRKVQPWADLGEDLKRVSGRYDCRHRDQGARGRANGVLDQSWGLHCHAGLSPAPGLAPSLLSGPQALAWGGGFFRDSDLRVQVSGPVSVSPGST